ncbi:MAG: RNA polymerase Rpb4 [Candidatus Bathyarchaeia archaeon]
MPFKIIGGRPISIQEVRRILECIGEENLDQFQKRTLDYTIKFSKIDVETAEKIIEELKKSFEITDDEAIEIVNCMPRSVEELRVFFAGGRRIIEAEKLNAIVKLLNEHLGE